MHIIFYSSIHNERTNQFTYELFRYFGSTKEKKELKDLEPVL